MPAIFSNMILSDKHSLCVAPIYTVWETMWISMGTSIVVKIDGHYKHIDAIMLQHFPNFRAFVLLCDFFYLTAPSIDDERGSTCSRHQMKLVAS